MVKIQTTILSPVHINVGNVRQKCCSVSVDNGLVISHVRKLFGNMIFFFVSTERGNVEKKRNPTSVYRALEFLY